MPIIIKPPFTFAAATQKVLLAQDLWNTKDPVRVAGAYTSDSVWRNRDQFFRGTDAIINFLTDKWKRELDYKLEKTLFCFQEDKIAVHFQYEYHNEMGQWFRAYGNEHWTFNSDGLMERRDMSCNDVPISETQRQFK
jgi:nuclear transport factor 2 (NTF2) superfamily protein